ncbi:hypothetical protein Tco_0441803 [Tanacetum coccineum]
MASCPIAMVEDSRLTGDLLWVCTVESNPRISIRGMAGTTFGMDTKADPEEVLGRKLWNEHSQDVIENMHKLPKATYD